MTEKAFEIVLKLIADLIEAKAKNKKEAANIVRELLKPKYKR